MGRIFRDHVEEAARAISGNESITALGIIMVNRNGSVETSFAKDDWASAFQLLGGVDHLKHRIHMHILDTQEEP